MKKKAFYILTAISVLMFALVSVTASDTDVFFLIGQGRDILRTGNLKTLYCFCGGEIGTVIQNYGWCVLLASAYDLLGNMGLFLLQTALYSVYVVMGTKLFCINCNEDCENYKNKGFVGFLVAMAGFSSYVNMRPEMMTCTLLMAEIYCIEKYRKDGRWQSLIPVPLAVFIEAQVHMSLLFLHIVVALPYLVPIVKENGAFKVRKPGKVAVPLLFITGSFLAGLLNPYGMDGFLYVFRSVGNVGRFGIQECQQMEFLDMSGLILMLFLVLFVLNFGRYAVPDIFMVCGLAFSIMMWIRQAMCLPVVIIFVARGVFAGRDGENGIASYIKGKKKGFGLHSDVFIASMLAGLMLTVSLTMFEDYGLPSRELHNKGFDGLDVIAEYIPMDRDRMIYTEFIDGSYLAFRGYKVFMDARPELYYRAINGVDDYGDMFLSVHYGWEDMPEVLESLKFDDLIVKAYSPAYWYLINDRNYNLTIKEGERVLFQRKSALWQ